MNEQAAQMAELTIERVRELLERATPGSWSLEMTGYVWTICSANRSPLAKPMYSKDSPLIAAAPDLARLCLFLHAQLRQEREGREKLRAALGAIEREAIVQYMSAFNHGPAAETIVKLARAALAQTAATPDSGGRL